MAKAVIHGMDVSFLDEIESEGGIFRDGEGPADCLAILKQSGVQAVRLRIWNDPPGGYCNLERTLRMARRIKEQGLRFLLDFHYSDGWADPAKQTKPRAWAELAFPELVHAVHAYTAEVLTALRDQGTLPDEVQIGNEITPGLLWDDGRVDGEWDTDEQWERLAVLVTSGIQAVREADSCIRIMIHIDRGGDNKGSRKFLDRFWELGVHYDTIGLSYYSWWHGDLEALRENLNDLAERYGKDLVVVETAYPWTLTPREGFAFIVSGEEQLHEGYPATVEGQAAYLRDFLSILREVPDGRGAGWYWWEPAWIPSKPEWSVGHSNGWSNLTLFDFDGRRLSSLDVLKE
ncbi:glycoside hydrolase family 53 protein [Gorillibacterium sp. sgz5001074]|uniref:glycoside hydrolase family 53 protein n=1 Tax=Gorillibacterium sp. sgz5001074 TaxID=3446695 RepID=UPI003F668750